MPQEKRLSSGLFSVCVLIPAIVPLHQIYTDYHYSFLYARNWLHLHIAFPV